MCPPVRRADTQVGPYTRPTIGNPKAAPLTKSSLSPFLDQ